MGRGSRRFLRDERGQSVVELGLAAPILIFALLGGLDLMRVASVNQAVQNAARAGAESATLQPSAQDSTILDTITAELSSSPGLGGVSATVDPTCWGTEPTPPDTSPAPAAGSAVYQFPCRSGRYQGVKSDSSRCPNPSSTKEAMCYLRVRVRYTFGTIVPWPFVPNRITVDRTVAAPMFR